MKKILASFSAIAIMGLAFTGCYKDIISPVNDPFAPPQNVSFSQELEPLFNSKCATAGCHASGSKAPVLESGKSYSALINGGYVNATVPDQSKIYLVVRPNGGSMAYLTQAEAKKVLDWIRNGGQNN